MIDKHGEIVVANHAYYEVLVQSKLLKIRAILDFLMIVLKSSLSRASELKKVIYDQIEVDINNVHTKYFDVSCVPILSKSRRNYKVWLLFFMILRISKLENLRREFVANVSHELKAQLLLSKVLLKPSLKGLKMMSNHSRCF